MNYVKTFPSLQAAYPSRETGRYYSPPQPHDPDNINAVYTTSRFIDKVKTIAERCKKINIVLSRNKFEIGNVIACAGLMISSRGIKPDPEIIKASTKFPAPPDISGGVRSFMGLVNQLSGFVPDFAHMTVKLRELKRNALF